MVLPVRIWPDPFLSLVAAPFATSDFADQEGEAARALHQLLDAMVETMRSMSGVGLAMPQVGVSKRGLVIVRDYGRPNESVVEMLNPVILHAASPARFPGEGCLSFPGERVDTTRFNEVTVQYLDRKGVSHTENLTDMNAVEVQHEIDHLDGKLIADLVGPTRRDMMRRRLVKIQKMLIAQAKREAK